jgi:hypothetical protein
MPQQLFPLTIQAPGFLGLNTQASAVGLGPAWSQVASNLVFDDAGRLAARQGVSALTSSPISGTPEVGAIIHYFQNATTDFVVSAANNILYSGDTTLTDITGSLTPTADDWKFENFNGNVVGFQAAHAPIYWAGSGNFTTIQSQHTDWAASTAYTAGQTVKATGGANATMYFVCTTGGTSAGSEPTWNTNDGDTTTDNTVTWTTVIIPAGNEVHAAFGRLWAVSSDKTTIKYSALLDESKWDVTNGGGTIDMLTVWTGGGDEIVSITSFNDFIIIFGRNNITVYSAPDDPTNIALADTLAGIGCIARDSVVPIGPDLVFLSKQGIRSFQRTVEQTSMPMQDISKNVRSNLVAIAAGTPENQIKAVFNQEDGTYLLRLGSFFYSVDLKALAEVGPRITFWNSFPIYSMYWSTRDDKLYLGGDGIVAEYDGYDDNGSSYILEYRSPWLDLSNLAPELANLLKMPKQIRATVVNGVGYSISYYWGFDFKSSQFTSKTIQFSTSATSEWGSAEWNDGEWAGQGGDVDTVHAHMKGHGQHIQYGFTVTVNGVYVGIQKVDLMIKVGRRIN